MQIYLKEKIGNPDLFSGRKKELAFFLNWIDRIKREISPSMALLSRRKTGKTALLQRLYNLTFHKNNGVIPFYFEVGEGSKWAVDFSKDFFLTFISQYIAFKTRKSKYLKSEKLKDFSQAVNIAKKEGFDYLINYIESVKKLAQDESVDLLWDTVREAPLAVATSRSEFIVQIIDEFQYLNSEIYWDKEKTNQANTFAAGYMRTAEYKNSPLIISGSWVGWLRYTLLTMLPSRFRQYFFENMPEEESIETIFNYSRIMDIPITEETAFLMSELCEGNPCYISLLFQSHYTGKDFTNQEGLQKTLEFETLSRQGVIRGTWMEYIQSIFARINEKNAKSIVLYLSKHRDREVSRKELLEKLSLDMTDFELEQKLRALEKADIIEEGSTNYDYKGVQDNIFDKVFRGVYQKEITEFDPKELTNEYKALFKKSQKKYNLLSGKYNREKGLFAEFLVINQLRTQAFKHNNVFLSFTHNLPDDFQFSEYLSVWTYKASPIEKRELNIDIFARAEDEHYSLICEVKNRIKKFSKKESEEFLSKMNALKEMENIEKSIGFVFSITGFTDDALDFFKENQIAWSMDDRWLGDTV